MARWVWRFWSDCRGAEVSELAVVLALLVAGSISTIALIGPKIQQMYTDVNSTLP